MQFKWPLSITHSLGQMSVHLLISIRCFIFLSKERDYQLCLLIWTVVYSCVKLSVKRREVCFYSTCAMDEKELSWPRSRAMWVVFSQAERNWAKDQWPNSSVKPTSGFWLIVEAHFWYYICHPGLYITGELNTANPSITVALSGVSWGS